MNRFLIIASLMFVTFSYSQKKGTGVVLRVEPNGVVVHKPVDVEHTLGINSEPVQEQHKQQNTNTPRTIDDFSTEELESMLYHADLKIEKIREEEGSDADALKYYKEQKQLIEKKLQIRKSK
ncbi:MAG: hypothetical protein AB7D46_03180 [Flavobacteriaceae bacterium]